jgi:hypothetical protein
MLLEKDSDPLIGYVCDGMEWSGMALFMRSISFPKNYS